MTDSFFRSLDFAAIAKTCAAAAKLVQKLSNSADLFGGEGDRQEHLYARAA